MNSQPTLVLDRVLRVMQPLVRLLLRSGVTYTVLAAALKRVFVQAARQELAQRRMPATDSAVTLLCGVHRRDVRELTRGALSPSAQAKAEGTTAALQTLPLGLAAQVVARWMNNPAFADPQGLPRALHKTGADPSFESLVAGISSDVRPRAVLEELLRLGVVHETEDGGLALEGSGFAPRHGFEELSQLFADNLHDHAAASATNLLGDTSFLEQAVFVDEITAASAGQLHQTAVLAWKQAVKTVLAEAQLRFDADALEAEPSSRNHRARFGVYFYSTPQDQDPPP